MTAATRLAEAWYRPRLTVSTALLVPLSWLYGGVVRARRRLYALGILQVHRIARPVVVIGNLTVGGGGKTPATIALARALATRGAVPGIVSRGYGGRATAPRRVAANDDPAQVGDEALLLAGTGFPVVVGRDRVAAAQALIDADPRCTVILSDDGLQHLALARDVEIVVIDTTRGFGNGHLLPAGPLREPAARIADADAIVRVGVTGPVSGDGRESVVVHHVLPWRRVVDDAENAEVASAWRGLRVHAIAGIANPRRFFDMLASLGIDAAGTPFPDHHAFVASDLPADADIVLMTQKDAVKCRRFADARCYYLPIEARLDPRLVERVQKLIGAA
ncbi:MAG: tetraacyldisaccharide 4'-kinase [Betaproteobacteria bacterium]